MSMLCTKLPRIAPAGTCGLALALAMLGFAACVQAAPLTLDRAVALAESGSPGLRARRASIEAAEVAVAPAGELPDPELMLGIENLPIDGEDRLSLTRDFMTMSKVGVMQSFPRKEKRELRSGLAAATATRERALLTAETLALKEAAARAWIELFVADQRLRLLQSIRPNAEAQLEAATAVLTSGAASAADGVAAQAALVALEDRIDVATADSESARAELMQWVPDLTNEPLGPAPDWNELGIEADALLDKIANHRDLLTFAADADAAAIELELARAEKRPDWSVELAYAQRGAEFSNMVSLEFRLGLPLFARGRQDPTIRSKQFVLERVDADREAAVRMQTTALRKALVTWRSTAARVRRYERELLPLGDDRSAAAMAAYANGGGDLRSTLMALEAAIEARLAYTDLLMTLAKAWATLHFAFPQER